MKILCESTFALLVAPLLALAGCGMDSASEDSDDGQLGTAAAALEVELDEAAQRRLGIVLEPLGESYFEERVEGPGVVLDAQPIVEVLAARIAAEAAARQSRAASERAAALFGSDTAVSREVLEAAQRQAAADEAALDVARAQALVSYGGGAPWFDPARRAHVVAALTEGDAVVVRASFTGGFPQGTQPSALEFRRIGERDSAQSWRSTDVWIGPADPAVPGPSLFAYVEPASGLVSGARTVASFRVGTRLEGVRVPAAAVVFAGGTAWCYLAEREDSFTRTAVDLARPTGDGYFQVRGFTAGTPIVVAGAGLLLASELGGTEEED